MDVLSKLYDAADSRDLPVLDALTERAGLIGECETCGWRNAGGKPTCEPCPASPSDVD